MFNPQIANNLPNGAAILRRRKVQENLWIWLAFRPNSTQRYVVWQSSDKGDTHSGFYTHSMVKAHQRFLDLVLDYTIGVV